jgi:hypothetical protein
LFFVLFFVSVDGSDHFGLLGVRDGLPLYMASNGMLSACSVVAILALLHDTVFQNQKVDVNWAGSVVRDGRWRVLTYVFRPEYVLSLAAQDRQYQQKPIENQ